MGLFMGGDRHNVVDESLSVRRILWFMCVVVKLKKRM